MSNAEEFDGQGFLVTGGTRGLGRSLVLTAAQRGARVVFCGRPGSESKARAVVERAARAGHEDRVFFTPADVSCEEDVEKLFDFAVDRIKDLNVLVNNAAITEDQLLISTSLEDWNKVMAVNLRGAFLTCRRAIEEFMAGGEGGRIVNVSSIAANGSAGQASYAASKSALLSLTRSIAKEYGRRGISCNSVVPGYLETEMTDAFSADARKIRERLSPHRRFGTPEEVVEAILFLASAESSFVNGDTLFVSGAVQDVPELRE